MAKIERRIKSAFTNAVPDVMDSVLKRCAESKGQVTDMANMTNKSQIIEVKSRRRPLIRIAAVVAAVLLLTVTVTAAVSLSGLQSVEDAKIAVLNHAVMNCGDEDDRDDLAALILSGMDCDSTAELAFSGVRPVYKMRTTIGGFIIDSTVDAKTLVVLDSKLEYEEELMERAIAEQNAKPKVDSEGNPYPEYPSYLASMQPKYILRDYYGLLDTEVKKQPVQSWCEYDESREHYLAYTDCDGYRYVAEIDIETLEIISTTVTELEGYVGERVLHEKVDGYISMVDAVKIVGEDMGVDLWKEAADKSGDTLLKSLGVQHMENVSWVKDYEGLIAYVVVYYGNYTYEYNLNAVNGEVLNMDRRLNSDIVMDKCAEYFGVRSNKLMAFQVSYSGSNATTAVAKFTLKTDGVAYKVTFDNETCEILSVEKDNQSEKEYLGFRNIYTLSTEAPKGMISEAEAAAIALEHFESNITQALEDFRFALDGTVYRISWGKYTFSNLEFPVINYTCDVDAKTGKILKSTPTLKHADLSDTSGFIGKEKAIELAKQHDENGNAVIEKITGVELGEMCVSASDSELTYTAVYQVHFDYKGREDQIWFYAVDAVTGEVYTTLGNGLYK